MYNYHSYRISLTWRFGGLEVEKTNLANSNRCIQYMIYTN